MYELAANLILIIHFAFIIFVIFGGLLFFISKKVVFIHFPALIWGSYIMFSHSSCPLTHLENWLLYKANQTTYSEGFIQHYIMPIVYPIGLTKDLQIYLGGTLIILNILIYGFILNKQRRN
ncbi:MAG: hypothetical protein CMD88_01345 [Gammaproteobacteria bacterium]|nr:hypothetical protein [Gammaproteobacteria bacterium]|tara:strand:+ start:565 stop:927 length:363 start_codon:yes stop_codon:yes gene_type:complete